MNGQPTWALEAEGVTKRYPGVVALENVTLRVRPGEVHGVVGENGAGKSTLMGIVSGLTRAEAGEVRIFGQRLAPATPQNARRLGLAIVHQEPVLLPDLTVAENMFLGVGQEHRPRNVDMKRWAGERLRAWNTDDLGINPAARVDTLLPEQRFIVEICRALAADPRVLVLDEPTEHLTGDDVERLLGKVRQRADAGCAVVYISHRIREVKSIAHRLTVLRNGRSQGTHDASELSEAGIVKLIVGHELTTTFPPKPDPERLVGRRLRVRGLASENLSGTDLDVAPGEVVGLAGVEGNGQREFLRALAGFGRTAGAVYVDGRRVPVRSTSAAANGGIAYVTSDRHNEGVFASLSVGDNIALRHLSKLSHAGVVSAHAERAFVDAAVSDFNVKTAGTAELIDSLSGGNQQKAILASALSSDPAVLLVDEPSQGVDVGARAEIYELLRQRATTTGMATVALSSDVSELAGLCDRVVVFSRGQAVRELRGDDVSEEKITEALLTATGERERRRQAGRTRHWLAGDTAPALLVGLAVVGLAAYAQFVNNLFLSPLSMSGTLTLSATLCFAALAQASVLFTRGIDLSVGPLMGFLVVVQSFFQTDGTLLAGQLTGWLLMAAIPLGVGAANWALVDMIRLHPMVATLVTFMALQALSLLLRPVPGGVISRGITGPLGTRAGPVPVTFIAAVILTAGLSWWLIRSRAGLALRAVGSDSGRAHAMGLHPSLVRLGAYVGSSLLAAVGAVTLMAQVGSGNPDAGTSYTLASIAAAVIGGVSLFGGRGSLAGVLFGALLVQVAVAVTTFLGLSTAWQFYLQGLLMIGAVAAYAKSRRQVSVAR